MINKIEDGRLHSRRKKNIWFVHGKHIVVGEVLGVGGIAIGDSGTRGQGLHGIARLYEGDTPAGNGASPVGLGRRSGNGGLCRSRRTLGGAAILVTDPVGIAGRLGFGGVEEEFLTYSRCSAAAAAGI